MFLQFLFRLQEEDIIRIFIAGDCQFGLEQIIQTEIFDRHAMEIMDHSPVYHQIELHNELRRH